MTVDPDRALVPLGQFRDTFIIAIDGEGLLDHRSARRARAHPLRAGARAADHRARSRASACSSRWCSSCRRRSARRWRCIRGRLTRFGFEVEEFGGDSLRVAAVPALLRFDERAAAVRALADDLEGLERGATRRGSRCSRIAATMACHAAVKAHDPLTLREDALHPHRAAPHRLFHRLSARPPGRAPPAAPRDREELRSRLIRSRPPASTFTLLTILAFRTNSSPFHRA